MGIIDGKFSKKKVGLFSYLSNQRDQDLYEYDRLQRQRMSLQKEMEQQKHNLWPQPKIQQAPQISGNASAFACAAIAILKILAITGAAISAAL